MACSVNQDYQILTGKLPVSNIPNRRVNWNIISTYMHSRNQHIKGVNYLSFAATVYDTTPFHDKISLRESFIIIHCKSSYGIIFMEEIITFTVENSR